MEVHGVIPGATRIQSLCDTALRAEGTLDIPLVADGFLFNTTTFLQEECFVQ